MLTETTSPQRARSTDRSLFVRWLSQIQRQYDGAEGLPSGVHVTRLVNALQLTRNGRVFATLRIDSDGLLFREWTAADIATDYASLNVTQARNLLDRCILRA